MDTIDLYNLHDDVLLKSNESFYNFVEQVTGKIEADILRVQGIRNARCLIRSTNLLAILELDCDEINKLKTDACFKCKDGVLIVRQGIRLNLDNLFDALKDKHDKYKKKNQQRQHELPSTIPVPSTPSTPGTNIDDNDSSDIRHSADGTVMGDSSDISLFTASTITISPSVSKYTSINDHVILIKDLVEKFSRKTFMSVILKQNEHYDLIVTQVGQTFKAIRKCQCGVKLMLPTRSDTSTFILSNFYAHLTASTCSMVNRIIEAQKKAATEESEAQSSSTPIPKPPMAASNEALASDIEVEILKSQGINNIPALLRAKDLYSIFKIDCEELEDLRKRACLKLNDSQYMVRPAIKENLDHCINVFKNKFHESQSPPEHSDQGLNTHSDCFMNTFIDSLTNNVYRSKHRYQYNANIRRFASSVFVLGGRNVYQFLQLNLPGAFPSIPTLESYNNDYCKRLEEGEFRFDELVNYSNKISCSFVYASEDCTGVVSKIHYDAENDSFVGFCPTLNNGLPAIRQYQTDDFFQLEDWFETVERSTLVDIFTIQHITAARSPPLLLSSFGTNNRTDSISILRRWLFILEQCHNDHIRIVGFSSDADSKYLRAMRLLTGYFAQLSNIDLLDRDDIFEVEIPDSWSSWFYLRPKQLLLCFQDSIHLATKLRNRLLSKTASLMIDSHRISIQDVENLIQNYSKIDHNLVSSDIYVEDKQKYASCVKISSENVLSMLNQNRKAYGTHCYLTILRFVTIAYIDKTTPILKRILYAWSVVFICRFWWTWLRYKLINQTKTTMRQTERPSVKKIEEHFITLPAFYSIELNAHVLTFILLLVLNKRLPVESLNIFLFSSQPCENIFRCARALTGPFSSMTTFTLQQFLTKTRKISILNEIKTLEESNFDSNVIKFRTHHKQNQNNSPLSVLTNLDGITMDKIVGSVYEAYEYAKSFVEKLGMLPLLKKNKFLNLNDLCSNMRDDSEDMIYLTDNCTLDSDDNLNDSDEETNSGYLSSSDLNSESDDEYYSETKEECTTTTKDGFNGMRIYSTVADKDRKKFFKITINGMKKFMHKQTAVWYLTKRNNRLSSDRLVRVRKTNKQE